MVTKMPKYALFIWVDLMVVVIVKKIGRDSVSNGNRIERPK